MCCYRGLYAFVCVWLGATHRVLRIRKGMRSDPCATGSYNRPVGLSLCDDKALRGLRVRVCVSQQVALSIGALVRRSGEVLINHIWQSKQGAHSELAGQGVLRTILLLLLKFWCESIVFLMCVHSRGVCPELHKSTLKCYQHLTQSRSNNFCADKCR